MHPNLRGNASRSDKKDIRIATHLSVLKFVVSNFEINSVIEHGMGKSSTPYFHSIPSVLTIVSFENDTKWQICNNCFSKQDSRRHTILTFEAQRLLQEINQIDPAKTLALVDGVGDERIVALQILQEQGVAFIVEHDSETLSLDNVLARNSLCTKNGYTAFQYVLENPESILYMKNSNTLSVDSKAFIKL